MIFTSERRFFGLFFPSLSFIRNDKYNHYVSSYILETVLRPKTDPPHIYSVRETTLKIEIIYRVQLVKNFI